MLWPISSIDIWIATQAPHRSLFAYVGIKGDEMKHDIVYILKQDVEADELRYSLRSVCKNFEYNRIWFYCGCPAGIKPDEHVAFEQRGRNKWERTRSTFRAICENDDISQQFYLFNDDFYIMSPYNQDAAITNGTLDMQIRRIEKNYSGETSYTARLRGCEKILRDRGLDTISYETHTPLLLDRTKALEILNTFNVNATFRSTYGNYNEIGGILLPDSKIVELQEEPPHDAAILSTSEKSFADGLIGKYIRGKFKNQCKYEVDDEL